MSKKIILIVAIILLSFCLVNVVSAQNTNETLESSDSIMEVSQTIGEDKALQVSDEEIISHDTEYPWVEFYTPEPNAKVSGVVDINLNVESHSEIKYANVTVENVNTRKVVFRAQDTNPYDGWGVSWDTSNVPNGKYYITAYVINALDLDDTWNIMVTLNNVEKSTFIVLDKSTAVIGQPCSITAHLYNGNSQIIANKTLTLSIDDTTLTANTGADGVALFYYTPNEVKNYNMLVKFNGDNLYSSSQSSDVLKTRSDINATFLTVVNVTGNTKENTTLKAKLRAKGFIEDSANKQIDFYVNNRKVGSALTDSNGDAEFIYTISEVGGKYVYAAEYYDVETEDAVVASSSLYVPQSSVYIKISALTYSKDGIFTAGNKLKVFYNVINEGPDAAEDVVFKYKVPSSLKYVSANWKSGSLNYDSSSKRITWNLGNLSVGNRTLEIEFIATKAAKNNVAPVLTTKTYDKSINNTISRNIITVNSYKIIAKDLVKYYTGSQKYKVYIKDSAGTPIKGATVKIIFNKKVVATLKTNSKGYVDLDVDLAVGKYTIKATCSSLSKISKITIKPYIITKNISVKKSKTAKFTAKLLNNNGKVLANKKVTFKLNGNKYVVKTNKKGVANVKFNNLKTGKHVVQTSYGKLTVKNIIKVSK